MARLALILGESGSGKSRGIKGLPPKKTVVVHAGIQDLPFKGAEKHYTLAGPDNPKGNFIRTSDIEKAAKFLKYVNKQRPEIKYMVVDDNQYFSMFEYVDRAYEREYYQKFVDIGVKMVQFAKLCKSFRSDLTVFILQHVETGTSAMGNEQIQAKTLGKFVKEKITYEGLFQPVLLCDKENDGDKVKHFYWTSLAGSTVKAPEEMFDSQKIENNLFLVAEAMEKYYNSED